MEKYTFLDKLTYADIAFEAYGKTLEELFTNAGLAVTESMVELESVQATQEHNFEVSAGSTEDLLYNFLEHIVMIKDSETLFLIDYELEIHEEKGTYFLKAHCFGDTIDQETQRLHNDVKAVTYHELKVEKVETLWKATVIIDV